MAACKEQRVGQIFTEGDEMGVINGAIFVIFIQKYSKRQQLQYLRKELRPRGNQ